MQKKIKLTSNGTGWACPSGVVLDVGFTGARPNMRGPAAKLVNRTVGEEAWKAPVDLLDEYHRHRYVVHVGNNGFSDSLWHKLASGALVLYAQSEWYEFYEPLLEEGVHFVRVAEDFHDSCTVVDQLEKTPSRAAEIAQNSLRFVSSILTVGLVDDYVRSMVLLSAENGRKDLLYASDAVVQPTETTFSTQRQGTRRNDKSTSSGLGSGNAPSSRPKEVVETGGQRPCQRPHK